MTARGRLRSLGFLVGVAAAGVPAAGFSAAGLAEAAPADSATASYWGPIPSRDNGRTTVFRPPSPSWWEYPVSVPYYAVSVPVRLVVEAGGLAVKGAERTGAAGFVKNLFDARTLPFGFGLGLSAGDLVGLGVGIDVWNRRTFTDRDETQAKFGLSTNGDRQATLGYRSQRHGGLQAGLGHRIDPNARFFGFGPASLEDRRSFFEEEVNWGGLSVELPLAGNFGLEVEGLYSSIRAGSPDEEFTPSLGDEFAGELPAGLGRSSRGVSGSLGFVHRDVDIDSRPETGGIRRASVTRYDETGLDVGSHWIFRSEIEQFVPLWYTQRALGLRAFAVWLEPVEGETIPFQRLAANDDPNPFRGYRENRWRDRGMIGGSAEYRWPIWEAKRTDGLGLDAYLLADVGQVFGRAEEIAARNLTVSYGGGFRLLSGSGFKGRLEIAASEEETVVRLRTDQLFQYAKGSLFHGRKPIPGR
jgi:hypothetical protein